MKKLLCILIVIVISFSFISCEKDPYQTELNKLKYNYERAYKELEKRMENEKEEFYNSEEAKDGLRQMGIDEDRIGYHMAGFWIITEDTKYKPMFRELEEQYQKDIESLNKKYNTETSNKNDIKNETANPVNISNDDEMGLLKQLIIDFDNAWIDYVNNSSQEIWQYIVPGSKVEENIKSFKSDGKTEEFLSIEVKDIKIEGDKAYIKVYEKLSVVSNGIETIKEYNWVYEALKRDDCWLLTDYNKDAEQVENKPVVERVQTDTGRVIEAQYIVEPEPVIREATVEEYKEALDHMTQLCADSHALFWRARISLRDTGMFKAFQEELDAITEIYNYNYEEFKKVGVPSDEKSKAIHEKAMKVFDFYHDHFNFILLALGEQGNDEELFGLLDSYEQGMYEAETTIRDHLRLYIIYK